MVVFFLLVQRYVTVVSTIPDHLKWTEKRGESMKELNESDLEHILLGCTVLGTGGGRRLQSGS